MSDFGDVEAIYAVLISRHASFERAQIESLVRMSAEDAEAALTGLLRSSKAAFLSDGTYLSDAAALRLENTARRTLEAFHRKNPLLRTMPMDGLRTVLPKAAEYRDFDAVIAFLRDQNVLVEEPDGRVRLPSHTVAMPDGWREAADDLTAVYESAGLQPPSPYNFQANYPRHINVRAILAILAEQGTLVHIEDELYLHETVFRRVEETVRGLAAAAPGGEITVGAVRDALQSTRKFVLPLLEYLNARGLTRREGDVHYLA